jgi:hypothetical protein
MGRITKKLSDAHPGTFMPSARRGALFEKTAPLDPPQKLFIHGQTSYHAS